MANKKKTHGLSIFLIKEDYKKVEDIANSSKCGEGINLEISGFDSATLLVKKNQTPVPKWAKLFENSLNVTDIIGGTKSVCALLVVKRQRRYFSLAFGQGGRFLLKDNVAEERFGLIVTLNSISRESLRCVDKQSLDSIESQSRTQSSYPTSANQFGIDIEQDMLKAVVGIPKNYSLGSKIGGTDSLSVSVSLDLSDLPALITEYKEKFDQELDQEEYQWVNNIALVKEKFLLGKLDNELIKKFRSQEFSNLWLAIPEIIDWELVKGFTFSGARKEMFLDISLDAFLSNRDVSEITKEELLSNKVNCVDEDFNYLFRSWTIYKCIYCEVNLDNDKFILNDGKWYRLAADFVQRTDEKFSEIKYSQLNLPLYEDANEGEYNKRVALLLPERFALLDVNNVRHGGGQGQVEICDLFSVDQEFIHIKHYGKSSVLSHLFSQGFVSGQLVQLDEDFRAKVIETLPEGFKDKVSKDRPDRGELKVVFGIISSAPGKYLKLPFFSRVNLNNTRKILEGFGCAVELLKIDVEESFAKLKKIREKAKRK